MPDIFNLSAKRWKQVFMLMFLTLLVAGIITFLQPRQFLSVATAIPATSFSADKSKIFSENIEALYSTLGSPDDLDMILGTAELDTVYLAVTDQFNLFDHYKVSGTTEVARLKATRLLERYSKVMKSEYGELKVKVWDTDKNLAPQLANAIMEKLGTIHRNLQNVNNKQDLQILLNGIKQIQVNLDSINRFLSNESPEAVTTEPYVVRKKVLAAQLEEYQKLIGQYQLIINSDSQVLLVVEKARPAIRPDKPRSLQIMIAAGVLSFLFAVLLVLVLDKRKTPVE
jgi:hypothetical protein